MAEKIFFFSEGSLTEELRGLLGSITHIPGIAEYQKVIAGAMEKLEKERSLSMEELQELMRTLNGLSVKIMDSDMDLALDASLLAKGLLRRLKEGA